MFGSDKNKEKKSDKKPKSDAQKALEERGKAFVRGTDLSVVRDTIITKDDYWAMVTDENDDYM